MNIALGVVIVTVGILLFFCSVKAFEDEDVLPAMMSFIFAVLMVIGGLDTIASAGHGTAVNIDDTWNARDFLSRGSYYETIVPSTADEYDYYSVIHKVGERERIVTLTSTSLPKCFIFTPDAPTRYSPAPDSMCE